MNDRISLLKEYFIYDKRHHTLRQGEVVDPSVYRGKELPDHRRTALRMKAMLEAEKPVIEPMERIVFTRTVSNAPLIFDDAEWAEIKAHHYIHENGNVCNLSPDYARLIRSGLLEARAKLGNTSHDESARIEIDAILDLTRRYEALARKKGMDDVAEVLARVPAHGARNLREALQSLRILHFALWCEGDYHNTLGRFDQYMLPYLGDLSEEEALALVEEFFLACNRDSDLYPGMQQGDNGQSMVLGGMLPDGTNGVNRLTHLALKASEELKVIDPKINLRVDKNTPRALFEEGTRLTRLGLGFPQYENDDVVIPGLEKLGYAPEDARNYVVAACWEFIIPGRGMDIPNIGAVPVAGVVDQAIRQTLLTAKSVEDILTRAGELLREKAAAIAESVKHLYVIPSPYMSLFFDVAPGKDIAEGSVYNNYGLHGTGVATAADSLAAVDQVVFREGMDPNAFLKAMDENFENTPELLYKLRIQCPKMGNDDDRADGFALPAAEPVCRRGAAPAQRAGRHLPGGHRRGHVLHMARRRPGRHRRRPAEGHAPFRQLRAVLEREAQRPGVPAEILCQAGFLPGHQRRPGDHRIPRQRVPQRRGHCQGRHPGAGLHPLGRPRTAIEHREFRRAAGRPGASGKL